MYARLQVQSNRAFHDLPVRGASSPRAMIVVEAVAAEVERHSPPSRWTWLPVDGDRDPGSLVASYGLVPQRSCNGTLPERSRMYAAEHSRQRVPDLLREAVAGLSRTASRRLARLTPLPLAARCAYCIVRRRTDCSTAHAYLELMTMTALPPAASPTQAAPASGRRQPRPRSSRVRASECWQSPPERPPQ